MDNWTAGTTGTTERTSNLRRKAEREHPDYFYVRSSPHSGTGLWQQVIMRHVCTGAEIEIALYF